MVLQPELNSNTSPTATLYTELPYPADGVRRTTNGRLILAGVKRHAPHLLGEKRLRIVDVGCGTGEHTVGLARFFPQAEIFGADINPASLDMARDLARRERTSIQFVHCDITRNLAERLNGLSPGRFDIVCSAGVLHHLADPRSGFSAVRQVIAPAGLFYCFMYTHFGRREEMAINSLLDEVFTGPVSLKVRAEAISQLRLGNVHALWNIIRRIPIRLKFGPSVRPLEALRTLLRRHRLTHESDSYSNPCEHLYRFAELKTLLRETGWDFVALAKHAGLPTTPEEHTRRPAELALLRQMTEEALYDYFALYYSAVGFCFFSRPQASDWFFDADAG
jgi:SAM-dependent methyltransferase